jgi:hypothetical protein
VRFDSEDQLHRAIAAHPEALPSEDVGLGPLVALANELDLGAGPMDLLAVDAQGRLVIIEFKRGSENPDVRRVVAQVLDYGSSLWRVAYEALEQRCRACKPGFSDSLAEHVQDALHRLGENYDEGTFLDGIARCLETGSFVFLYVGRDLDERTRRIMTYLADGARMTFFAARSITFTRVTRTLLYWCRGPPSCLHGSLRPWGCRTPRLRRPSRPPQRKHVTSLAG